MLYAQVSAERQVALTKALQKAHKTKWYRRLKIIELSGQGKTVQELSSLFDVSAATIRDYIKRYNNGGLSELKPNYDRSGRQPTISWSKAEWEGLLKRSPSQFEKLNTAARNWTQALLVDYFAAYEQLTVAQEVISGRLKQVGISWKRAKLKVTSPDPLYEIKRKRVESLKKSQNRAIK